MLRLTLTAGNAGFDRCQGTKIPHAAWHSQERKEGREREGRRKNGRKTD